MTQTIALDRSREFAFGFLYWLTFLIALGSGKLLRTVGTAAIDGEALRLLFASMLGAMSAPVVLHLMRRFPIERGDRLSTHLLIHAASAFAMALALIVVSCLLAPVFQIGDTRPFLIALPSHLQANWLLLAFCILAFMGLVQAVRAMPHAAVKALEVTQPSPAFRTTVAVRCAQGPVEIAVNEIDWIETQGNYLALHVGARTYLTRETLIRFEADLDPAAFARIHRRTLVALDRVRGVEPLGNGDATIRLLTGTDLRLSRSYASKFRAVMADAGSNVRP